MAREQEAAPLVARMTHLLLQVPSSQRQEAMEEVVSQMSQDGLLQGQPSRDDAEAFSRELFQMANLPMPSTNILHSIKYAESPLDMIDRLTPSDHHLD